MSQKFWPRNRRMIFVVLAVMASLAGCADPTGGGDGEGPGAALPSGGNGGSRPTLPVPTTLPPGEVALTGEDLVDASQLFKSLKPVTANGISYTNGLVLENYSSRNSWIEINAGRQYRRFRGELSVPDTQPSATAYKVEITIDTSAPVFSTEIRFGQTKMIDLDVSNVLRIKVSLSPIECCHAIVLGAPRFQR